MDPLTFLGAELFVRYHIKKETFMNLLDPTWSKVPLARAFYTKEEFAY
jgi:hypothetical protein